ncbi:MAG: ribosomal protein S18-alanine N-acetyltransferase [Nitrospirae bacterium]|nr:ribosomal protein S18-alanine N-acetyltransferase [Nitrospirota bacterium]
MSGILIRHMTEQDIASVVAIEKASFSLPWSETSFRNELYKPRSMPRVAVEEAVVAGYVCAQTAADEGHILNLAVHPDYRRRGIAAALVAHVIAEFKERGCRFVYLEVRASNHAAKRLYEGFGFTLVGTRKSYYVVPTEDAAIMMLEI